uniref:Uncharacterized protein n=1 Tax=Monopterus albus TaxID=43700 RepID=A0A3Q3Q9A3_MONAL
MTGQQTPDCVHSPIKEKRPKLQEPTRIRPRTRAVGLEDGLDARQGLRRGRSGGRLQCSPPGTGTKVASAHWPTRSGAGTATGTEAAWAHRPSRSGAGSRAAASANPSGAGSRSLANPSGAGSRSLANPSGAGSRSLVNPSGAGSRASASQQCPGMCETETRLWAIKKI